MRTKPESSSRALLAVAIFVTVIDIALAAIALVVVFSTDDLATIISGDVLMCVACLLAVPVLHYWAEGRRG